MLCSLNKKREWSAVLFYTEIEVPDVYKDAYEMAYSLVDLYLMDVGTAAHTGYEFTPELITYIHKNDLNEKKNIVYGNIHSHNTMDAFFSGEDENDLAENLLANNMYLSVIVNNDDMYVGKLAVKIDKQMTYTFLDGQGKQRSSSINEESKAFYSCAFSLPYTSDLLIRNSDLVKRAEAIAAEKALLHAEKFQNNQPSTYFPDMTETKNNNFQGKNKNKNKNNQYNQFNQFNNSTKKDRYEFDAEREELGTSVRRPLSVAKVSDSSQI